MGDKLKQVLNNKSLKTLSLQGFVTIIYAISGELGIRTPGPVTVNSFQDCRNRPLCQLSGAKVRPERLQPKLYKYNQLVILNDPIKHQGFMTTGLLVFNIFVFISGKVYLK